MFFYVGLKYTGNIFLCTLAISNGDNDETRLQNNNHVLGKLKAMLLNTYELSLSVMDCQVSSLILPCFPLAPAPFIFPNNLSSYFKTSSIRIICSSEDQLAPFSSSLQILNIQYRFRPYLIKTTHRRQLLLHVRKKHYVKNPRNNAFLFAQLGQLS